MIKKNKTKNKTISSEKHNNIITNTQQYDKKTKQKNNIIRKTQQYQHIQFTHNNEIALNPKRLK